MAASSSCCSKVASKSTLTGKCHTQRTRSRTIARVRLSTETITAEPPGSAARPPLWALGNNGALADGKTLGSRPVLCSFAAKKAAPSPTHGRLGDERVTWQPSKADGPAPTRSTPPRQAAQAHQHHGAREGSRGRGALPGINRRRADPRPSQTVPQPAIDYWIEQEGDDREDASDPQRRRPRDTVAHRPHR